MKTDRRWVAWMAALMFATMLAATPRSGAAGPTGPYYFPDPDPGPVFGEPDEPSAPSLRAQLRDWLIRTRFGAWILRRDSLAPQLATKPRAPEPASAMVTKHE